MLNIFKDKRKAEYSERTHEIGVDYIMVTLPLLIFIFVIIGIMTPIYWVSSQITGLLMGD